VSAVTDALAEIAAAVAALATPHEGLRDWTRINLQAPAAAEIRAALAQFDKRAAALAAAKAALEALVADGYPALEPRPVDAAVLGDLRDNAATIAAAFALFTPVTAAVLNLTAGPPEPKGGS
jgi:hypothetical protein